MCVCACVCVSVGVWVCGCVGGLGVVSVVYGRRLRYVVCALPPVSSLCGWGVRSCYCVLCCAWYKYVTITLCGASVYV